MAYLTLPPTAPQRGDRTTFANRVDAFITWLINFVNEMLVLVTGLNVLAAGGAYSIPYTFATFNGSLGGGNGFLAFQGGVAQNVAAFISVDTSIPLSGWGDISSFLGTFSDSTSTVKGHITVRKSGAPSTFLTFRVDSIGTRTGIRDIYGAVIAASSANPFSNGDALTLQFTRTGDKGDTGPSGYTPTYMYVRDEKSNGTGGGVATNGATARTLNTVKVNTISGASLASNAVTLPAGTYEYVGSVPGYQCNAFQAQLWNSTDGAAVDMGTSETSTASSGAQARSVVRGTFTITSSKSFQLRHLQVNGSAGTFGQPASNANSVAEVYAEILFRKIA